MLNFIPCKARSILARCGGTPFVQSIRLPGKGNSNSHGARPVYLIITMVKWIRTSRLSIKNSLSLSNRAESKQPCGGAPGAQLPGVQLLSGKNLARGSKPSALGASRRYTVSGERAVGCNLKLTSERRGNSCNDFEDFYPKAKASVWP